MGPPRTLRESAEGIRCGEVSRVLARLGLSQEDKEVIERMSHDLVDALLCGPISETMPPQALAHRASESRSSNEKVGTDGTKP